MGRQYANWNGNFVYDPYNRKIREDGAVGRIADLRIRRLTPLECFRLQGFPDDVYYKAKEIGISDAQLYKMTGNTITVQIAQTIARLLKRKLKRKK
jgi:site-specific DNA-cytosine methylase